MSWLFNPPMVWARNKWHNQKDEWEKDYKNATTTTMLSTDLKKRKKENKIRTNAWHTWLASLAKNLLRTTHRQNQNQNQNSKSKSFWSLEFFGVPGISGSLWSLDFSIFKIFPVNFKLAFFNASIFQFLRFFDFSGFFFSTFQFRKLRGCLSR